MGSALPVSGKMVLAILLLSLVLTKTGTDAKSSLGLEDLENLVKQMELKMKDMESRLEETETKNKEMETRLEELEEQLKECSEGLGKIDSDLEASKSEQKRGAENSSTKESRIQKPDLEEKERASSYPRNALTKPSLRDLPIILISASRRSALTSSHPFPTVTFDTFLANYNNGGGDGKLDLDSGIFTCLTPGYYTVSFSVYGAVGTIKGVRYGEIDMFLFKNGRDIPDSWWTAYEESGNATVGVTGSRIVIIHMDAGDTLELKMTHGDYIKWITLNIELSG